MKLIAVLAVCAIASGQTLQLINSRLTADGLKSDVSFLASDVLQGRGTPSPGLDIAAEYIASQFRRAGLEPVGDDGFFQTAAFETVTPNLEGLEVIVEGNGAIATAKPGTVAALQSAALDITKAQVVKLGAGDAASIEALTLEQVRGKVLLFDVPSGQIPFSALRQLPMLALKLRPTLILILRSGPQPANPPRPRESTTAAATPVLVVWDEDVRMALGAGKTEPLEGTLTVHLAGPSVTPVKLRNVVGVLRGADPALRDTYVMLTAHYDHLGVSSGGEGDRINNGANDDASGTASVIEVANTLAALPTRPKRSIIFVTFFGEELGLLGSHYYGAHPVVPLSKTVADVNLEHMGRTDVDGGTSVGLVNVTGFDFSTLTDAVVQAGAQTGLQVIKHEKYNERFFAQSDNQALADAGVPAHTLSVGYLFPDYHKPSDEWPKLDYANMAIVDRTVALAIYNLADSVEAPQWKDIPQTQTYIKARQAK